MSWIVLSSHFFTTKQYCSQGNRGKSGKTRQNYQRCSKTFGRYCLNFISMTVSYRNRNFMHPRVFDCPDFICGHQKAAGIVAKRNLSCKPFNQMREIMAICIECQKFQMLIVPDISYVRKCQCPKFFVVRNIQRPRFSAESEITAKHFHFLKTMCCSLYALH